MNTNYYFPIIPDPNFQQPRIQLWIPTGNTKSRHHKNVLWCWNNLNCTLDICQYIPCSNIVRCLGISKYYDVDDVACPLCSTCSQQHACPLCSTSSQQHACPLCSTSSQQHACPLCSTWSQQHACPLCSTSSQQHACPLCSTGSQQHLCPLCSTSSQQHACLLCSTSSQQHASKSIPQASVSYALSTIKNSIYCPFLNGLTNLSFLTRIFGTLVIPKFFHLIDCTLFWRYLPDVLVKLDLVTHESRWPDDVLYLKLLWQVRHLLLPLNFQIILLRILCLFYFAHATLKVTSATKLFFPIK